MVNGNFGDGVELQKTVSPNPPLPQSEIGPYYSFGTKDISSILKQLTTLQHPFIVPITLATFNQVFETAFQKINQQNYLP